MSSINLLPWREELREHKKREFYLIAGAGVLLAIVLLIVADLIISSQINDQNRRFFRNQIKKRNRFACLVANLRIRHFIANQNRTDFIGFVLCKKHLLTSKTEK